jgi:hypothetical protein
MNYVFFNPGPGKHLRTAEEGTHRERRKPRCDANRLHAQYPKTYQAAAIMSVALFLLANLSAVVLWIAFPNVLDAAREEIAIAITISLFSMAGIGVLARRFE